jgi:hypothetical protein
LFVELLEDRQLLATFTVTNTLDSGAGSLRQAILDANADAILDTIRFNIPGSGVQTIRPTSGVLFVGQPVVIDGTTQPGFAGTPLIELDGSLAGSVDGLAVAGGGSTIKGLVINNFNGNGISLFNGGGNTVAGNYIGTDPSGTLARPNGAGVVVFSANNTIGGTAPAARNVVSGNRLSGVQVVSTTATGNLVQGNYVGMTAAGTAALANGGDGVLINGGARNNTVGGTAAGAGNVLSGNTFHGVQIADAGTSNNLVQGNCIGTNPAGSAALPNAGDGVLINNGATNNTVGGTTAAARNLIAGNTSHGVQIGDAGTSGNQVQGNLIGLNAAGTAALGNNDGVLINFGARNNTIGGTAAGAGNVIGGNRAEGVQIADAASTGNLVQGNFIGTDGSETAVLPNADAGVLLNFGATGSTIGGTTAAAGNVIAFNPRAGILIADDAGTGNTVRANSIYNNGGLGIDLGSDFGVTPNHQGGSSTGPNRWQNYPVLRTATPGTSTAVGGTLNGPAGTTFTLDFYASPAPHSSLFGDGRRYLGSATTTTNASGNASFTITLPAATTNGEWLTATATDPSGNTSEFSAARQLPVQDYQLSPPSWTPLGPTPNAGAPLGGIVFAGRVNAAAPDPSNANVMYLMADGGGVWKTTNWLSPFPTWTPLTDGQPSATSTSAYQVLAVAPQNPNLIYAAVNGPSGGILKSLDGGASWSFLANAQFDLVSFGALVVSPTDANTLFAAVVAGPFGVPGVYRSVDGGVNWTNTTAAIHSGGAWDVVMDPSNPQVLYAGLSQFGAGLASSGVYKTTNGGASWTRLGNGLPTGSGVGTGIRLNVARSDPQTVYAIIHDPATRQPRRFKSSNGGASWAPLGALPGPEDNRYWHDVLGIDPTNPQVLFVNGDHSLFRSSNGGQTWTQIFNGSEDPVSGTFDNTGAFILTADRGIYRMTGPSFALVDKNFNLQTTQFYTLTPDPTNPDVVYGVAQDFFSPLRFSGAPVWNILGPIPNGEADGGETGKVLVSPANPNRVYHFSPSNERTLVIRSDDGGATWVERGSGIPTSDTGFRTNLPFTSQKAFTMDPSNPLRLLAGVRRVYETTNGADSWTAISPPLSTDQANNAFITAISIAPSAPGTIYAATADGHVWVTTNGGGQWLQRDAGLPGDPSNYVVDIRIDPANPNRAFAVPGTYPTGLFGNAHVWLTTNGGASWTDIRGNLAPTNFTNALAVDWRPATPVLYVATARGVYRSTDLGGSWARFGQGLPNATVTDLQLLPQFNRLAASTYGRGAWEILVPPPATTLVVTSLTPTATGFVAQFNRALDPSVLNLYDTQTGGLGPADVTLTGPGGVVTGSLAVSPDATRVTFLQTGGILAPGSYTVTLRSAADGFKDADGNLLDGNGDGTPGDNYTSTFTVAPSSAIVVSVPDFLRGPGQAVNVPATATGLPLHLSEANGITLVHLTLLYDPTLLVITAAAVAPGLPASATVTLNTATPGQAVVNFTSPTPLAAGARDVVLLTASVPNGAGYTSKEVLDLTGIQINGGALPALDDDGLHVAAYFGDTSGNGSYSAIDATRALRVAVGLDGGFTAYQLADPLLVADITGNGMLNATDATRILQFSLGQSVPQIPPFPGLPSITPGGPDPRLSIPKHFRARPGGLVTVPVRLDFSEGLESAELALSFDPSQLAVVSVRRGSLTRDFDLFAQNVDGEAGTLRVGLGRSAGPVQGRGAGSLVVVTFRIRTDAPARAVVLNLRRSLGQTVTQVNEGNFDLNPDPSDAVGDALDGLIRILPPAKRSRHPLRLPH